MSDYLRAVPGGPRNGLPPPVGYTYDGTGEDTLTSRVLHATLDAIALGTTGYAGRDGYKMPKEPRRDRKKLRDTGPWPMAPKGRCLGCGYAQGSTDCALSCEGREDHATGP